jgi:CRISPR-associated protein (TIGR03984 family)
MNKPYCQHIDDVKELVNSDRTLRDWLQEQAKSHQLKYLLAHADDGVIWGEFRGENYDLVTSGDVFSPELTNLRYQTLQQCRAFGRDAEVMLWKVEQTPKARLIKDDLQTEYIPEDHILWGTQIDKAENGFSLVSDGQQGLRHGIPLSKTVIKFNKSKKLDRPLRLSVRHYIDCHEETGLTRIYLSRLVNLNYV